MSIFSKTSFESIFCLARPFKLLLYCSLNSGNKWGAKWRQNLKSYFLPCSTLGKNSHNQVEFNSNLNSGNDFSTTWENRSKVEENKRSNFIFGQIILAFLIVTCKLAHLENFCFVQDEFMATPLMGRKMTYSNISTGQR